MIIIKSSKYILGDIATVVLVLTTALPMVTIRDHNDDEYQLIS